MLTSVFFPRKATTKWAVTVLHQAASRSALREGQGWFGMPLLRYRGVMKPVPHFLVVSVWAVSLCLMGVSLLARPRASAHGVSKTLPKSSQHHTTNSRLVQARVCYRMASGVIVLEQMPNSGRRLGRGGGFAPIGEAVFRSSNRLHACPTTHGRRG